MSRLEEILSEHIEGGAGAWKKLYDDIEQYARECCIASLEKASGNAEANIIDNYVGFDRMYEKVAQVDIDSIITTDNVVLL